MTTAAIKPQITLTQRSPTGFTVETDAFRQTLHYSVKEAVRAASIQLGFVDAEITCIKPGQITVVVPSHALSPDDLAGVLYLTARKFAQVNDRGTTADIRQLLVAWS